MYETGVTDQRLTRGPQRVTLAPIVPDLAALGANDVQDLLGVGGQLSEEPRAQEVSRDAQGVLLRCPLPGTPTESGAPLTGRPRGAGTGFVYLRRYRAAPWRALLRARFTHPRSESLAEREWNLLCHLRAAGISTPEPMAVVSAGGGVFARRSAVVTRELDGMRPALDTLESIAGEGGAERRRHAVRALGIALGRLLAAGVELPRCSVHHIYLGEARAAQRANVASDACAADQILAAKSNACANGPPIVPGLRWSRLPEVALASVRGGRIVPGGLSLARRQELLARLDTEPRVRRVLSEHERLRIFLLSTARGFPRAARRAALTRISARVASTCSPAS